MQEKKLNQDQVIDLLRKRQGDRTAKELAEEFGITPQYLSDVYLRRREPGPGILVPLGLEAETVYVPAITAAD